MGWGYMRLCCHLVGSWSLIILSGAGVALGLCNGLPCNDPGFDSRRGWFKNRASRTSQGTVNGGAVSK